MTYKEYYDSVRAECILIDNKTDKWFIKPDCRYYMNNLDFHLADVTDFPDATTDTVVEQMQYEVTLHNYLFDDSKVVVSWIKELIDSAANPELTEQQNELATEFMEFLQKKNKKSTRKKKTDTTELKTELVNTEEA